MTKEERSEKSKQQAAERKEYRARMFGARIDNGCAKEFGLIVEMEIGDERILTVRQRSGDDAPWETRHIVIGNQPERLALFIRALSARYNAIVDRINEDAGAVSLLKCKRIDP